MQQYFRHFIFYVLKRAYYYWLYFNCFINFNCFNFIFYIALLMLLLDASHSFSSRYCCCPLQYSLAPCKNLRTCLPTYEDTFLVGLVFTKARCDTSKSRYREECRNGIRIIPSHVEIVPTLEIRREVKRERVIRGSAALERARRSVARIIWTTL